VQKSGMTHRMHTLTRYTGYHVGIIGNRIPVINGDEASKGAQFIRQCNQM
jgi:acetyl-CoA carboxylase carboxyltransferase component